MLRLTFFALAALAAAGAPAFGVTLTVSSYEYVAGTAPSATYPDTGGTQLTDGVTGGLWNVDPGPWVGFQERDGIGPLVDGDGVGPTIRFDFDGPVTIDVLGLYLQQSSSGQIFLPPSIQVAFSSGGPTQTIATNGSSFGAESVGFVEYALTGSAADRTGTSVWITLAEPAGIGENPQNPQFGGHTWIFLAEAAFNGAIAPDQPPPAPVPEPGAIALALAGAGALVRRARVRS